MALLASSCDGRVPLRQCQRVRETLCAAWLELFAEDNLFWTQTLFAVDGGPTRRRVAATKKLLINAFVTRAAISGSQMRADHKPMVIDLLLAGAGLVAIETIDTLLGMGGHFVFMHH
jgi:hypothetical protein